MIITSFCLLVLSACTDKEAEEKITGHWHAVSLTVDSSGTEHKLPEGIYLVFDYPRYSFQGEDTEEGKYYIKDDQLFLLDQSGDQLRKMKILSITPDTLTLVMKDSTDQNQIVKFTQQ